MITVFKLEDKVAGFKAKLELWGWLVHDHLSLLLKEFERCFPSTKDPRTGKEWMRDPFFNKSGESVQEEDQLLEIANDGGLKTTFETTTLRFSGLKSRRNTLRLPPEH
ncbi:hypothetical protein AVEN_198582-1 [Araneus ventricosus]|uniref:Uncharacterized protein n=1 Tax=Araneus ventricosus TaxID=182803 RepID=A0A4Y2U7S3_ARAVE|nr:hypothetical protein AVEN_198582-1 [Araneus ventricosus]